MLLRPVLMPILRNPLQGIADGIRNMLAELLGSSQFFAPLTHSLVLARGTGSPTFTRADATNCATFRDWEGALKTVPSGCARFEGARMVQNRVVNSEDFTAWTPNGTATVDSDAVVGPDGVTLADTISFSGGGAQVLNLSNRTYVAGNTYVYQVKAQGVVGGEKFRFKLYDGTTDLYSSDITVTTDWALYTATFVAGASTTAGNDSIGIDSAITAVSISFFGAQLEDVTGQADQTASEYVSVGATPINLCLQSQTIATAPWALGNGIAVTADQYVAPDGTTTVDKLTALAGNTQHFWYQSITTPAGVATYSVYLRYVNNQWARIGIYDGAASYYAAFDILNGVVGSTVGPVTATAIEPMADGITWRVSITATIGASALSQVYLSVVDADDPSFGLWNAVGTEAIGAWGTQLQTGSTATTYIPTTTVAKAYNEYHGAGVDGVEFFNTDRDGAVIPAAANTGYLAEGARTNLCLQSQTFGTTWAVSAGANAISADQTTAPDGTTTADKLYEKSDAVAKYVFQAVTITAAATTWSVYAKPAGRTWIGIDAYDGSAHISYFDIGNGATGANAAGNTSTITSVGDGWYRCTVTRTSAGTGGYIQIYLAEADNDTAYTGDGASGVYLWGAQLELGSFASSYIPTTTAAVTRAADVLTYPSAGNIDGTVGWCYAEAASAFSTTSSVATVLGFGSSAGVGNAGIAVWATAATAISVSDLTNRVEKTGLNSLQNATQKLASSWGGSTQAITGGGATVASGTFDGNNSPTAIEVGALGGYNYWFGTIRNVRIGQRQLSASELQAITA